MDIYSKPNGPLSVYPASGGVWAIRKKRKADDEKPRDKRKGARDGKAPDDDFIPVEIEYGYDSGSLEMDHHIGYDSAGKSKGLKRKIDVTI